MRNKIYSFKDLNLNKFINNKDNLEKDWEFLFRNNLSKENFRKFDKYKNPNEFWNQQAPPKKSFEEPTGLDELRRKQKEKQRPLTSFTDDVFEPVSPKKKKSSQFIKV